MATDKPRITLTLDPSHYVVIQRLAKLQKSPMSRVLSDLVSEVAPALERVVESLEIAQRAQEGVKANLRRAAEETEEEMRPLVDAVLNQLDLFTAQAVSLVQPEAARVEASEAPEQQALACSGASEGSTERNPQPVITGATDVQQDSKTASVRRRGLLKMHHLGVSDAL